MRAALLRAYRSTAYEVDGVAVFVGRRSPGLDVLLMTRGVHEAVYITAYNPYSIAKPPGWNFRMQGRLAEALRRRAVLPAIGRWRRWSESHLLVFGDARPMHRLARRFRQNAIVMVRLRQPARLLLTFQRG